MKMHAKTDPNRTCGWKARAVLLIIAALLLAGCDQRATVEPAATAAPPKVGVEANADWSSLWADVGKYPHDFLLFDDSAISHDLERMLGSRLSTFKQNMQVSGPLQKDGDTLYVVGNRPHEGGTDVAYLLISPATRSLEAGLLERAHLSIFRFGSAEIAKPEDVKNLIANASPPAETR